MWWMDGGGEREMRTQSAGSSPASVEVSLVELAAMLLSISLEGINEDMWRPWRRGAARASRSRLRRRLVVAILGRNISSGKEKVENLNFVYEKLPIVKYIRI